MSNTVVVAGQTFEVCKQHLPWNATPGVYIFVIWNGYRYVPLYVGQTDDFSRRMPNHERWREAVGRGANHIFAKVVPRQADRDALERYLIQQLKPPMNVHYA